MTSGPLLPSVSPSPGGASPTSPGSPQREAGSGRGFAAMLDGKMVQLGAPSDGAPPASPASPPAPPAPPLGPGVGSADPLVGEGGGEAAHAWLDAPRVPVPAPGEPALTALPEGRAVSSDAAGPLDPKRAPGAPLVGAMPANASPAEAASHRAPPLAGDPSSSGPTPQTPQPVASPSLPSAAPAGPASFAAAFSAPAALATPQGEITATTAVSSPSGPSPVQAGAVPQSVLAAAPTMTGAPASAEPAQAMARSASVVRHTMEAMAGAVKVAPRSVEVRLDPPELGRIAISIVASDGDVRAVIRVERPEALEALRAEFRHLERGLADLTGRAQGEASVQLSSDERGLRQGRGDGASRHDHAGDQPADDAQDDAPSPMNRNPDAGDGPLDVRL